MTTVVDVTFFESFRSELESDGVAKDLIDIALARAIHSFGVDPIETSSPSPLGKKMKTEDKTTASTLLGQQAVDLVEAKIATGEWKRVTATSTRSNSAQYSHMPTRTYTFEFIVDGAKRTTFEHKETIKNAGYRHYSKSDRAGWAPFELEGGARGFGREVPSSES